MFQTLRRGDRGINEASILLTGRALGLSAIGALCDLVVVHLANEVGVAPPRGRLVVPPDEAERELSALVGQAVELPDNAVVSRGPSTCPACGSTEVEWGCSDYDPDRGKEDIHPLVWHETEWMADSFLCRSCDAGWIEPDEPEPITWVRPYWRVPNE